MDLLLGALGFVLIFVGLLASIALHELGHFSFAKLFKVRTTQFMVGFGPTMWSKRKGETEYGIKWIPLGGYIRMIGMLPPRKGDAPGQVRNISTGPWQGLIESARGAALEEVRPDDTDRVFYNKKWWQKFIVMFAGPAMNLVLAVFFFAVLLMGIGIEKPQAQISTVSECIVPASDSAKVKDNQCPAGAQKTPAYAAGMKPGDRITAFDGTKIESYPQLQELIRGAGGKTVPVAVDRGGKAMAFSVPIALNQLPDLKDSKKTVNVGFLGMTPTVGLERQGPGAVATVMTELTKRTAESLLHMPQKMVGVWNAAFSGDKRDPNGPIGVVGVGRVGAEVFTSEQPGVAKLAFFVQILGSLNLAVALFNLVPLLPLDGGHMAGALLEGIKKGFAKIFRRPDPGPVDVAKLLPVTYVVASVLVVMGALLIIADVVNPIRLLG